MPDPGCLTVCATPIGNLGDVTLRVLNALGEADTRAMADRIAVAEDAIIERAHELQRICQCGTELQDLTKALCSLGDLRRRKLFPHAFFADRGNNSPAA